MNIENLVDKKKKPTSVKRGRPTTMKMKYMPFEEKNAIVSTTEETMTFITQLQKEKDQMHMEAS